MEPGIEVVQGGVGIGVRFTGTNLNRTIVDLFDFEERALCKKHTEKNCPKQTNETESSRI